MPWSEVKTISVLSYRPASFRISHQPADALVDARTRLVVLCQLLAGLGRVGQEGRDGDILPDRRTLP